MASKTWTAGTVIDSAWLQDVDDTAYYTATGTGAVERKGFQKFGELITNTDYSTMQQALTAAAGKTLVIVPGTYNMGSTALTVPAGTTVIADGATLTWSSHLIGITFTGSTTVRSRWKGGKLVGAGNSSYTFGSYAMYCAGTSNAPSAPTYVLGPEIDGVEIDGWGDYGFYGKYLDGGKFINSPAIKNIGYTGIGVLSTQNFIVAKNVISNITPGSGGGDAYGVFFSRLSGASNTETADPRSTNCIAALNHISNVIASTVNNGQGVDTHGGTGIVVTGNTITNCQAGVYLTSSSIGGTQLLAPKNCMVTNNVIKTSYKLNYGIYSGGAINGGVPAEYAESILIEGNTVEGHGLAGAGTTGALFFQCTKGLTVSSNVLKNSACSGIVMGPENLGFSISGGTITDPHDNTYGHPNCVLFTDNNNTGYVGGIVFNYTNGALATYVAIGSIRINTGLTGLDIEIGKCAHIGLDATHLQYVPLTTTGVNSTGLVELAGSNTLTAGVYTLTFSKRFPAVPRVLVTNTSDLNPIRISAISATGCTFAGTGTTAFTWRASL